MYNIVLEYQCAQQYKSRLITEHTGGAKKMYTHNTQITSLKCIYIFWHLVYVIKLHCKEIRTFPVV